MTLDIHCIRRIGVHEVSAQLVNAMIVHGIPKYIRSDNGSEFVANHLASEWLIHAWQSLRERIL